MIIFSDPCAGPGVNAAWTIEQVGGNDAIIQSGDSYRRETDADSTDLATSLKSLTQTLAATPSTIQAEFSIHEEYSSWTKRRIN